MKQFVLLFRMDLTTKRAQPSKRQLEIYMEQWITWITSLSDLGQLADGGNHFSKQGRVLRPNKVVSDTPYISEDNSVAGYIIVNANGLDGASKLAEACPILKGENTSVEIREVASPGV